MMRRVHVSAFRMVQTIPVAPPPPDQLAYEQDLAAASTAVQLLAVASGLPIPPRSDEESDVQHHARLLVSIERIVANFDGQRRAKKAKVARQIRADLLELGCMSPDPLAIRAALVDLEKPDRR